MSSTVHDLPGRLRVKIPAICRNPDLASHVKSIFTDMHGVDRATVNELTGSLKISYDPDRIQAPQLMAILEANALIDENWIALSEAEKHKAAVQATRAVGKAIINWSVGRALEANGLGIIAALI